MTSRTTKLTAREALADWYDRAGNVLDVGQQRNGGYTYLTGACWLCLSTAATNDLGVCGSCLSWLRCEDLGADSAAATTTLSSSSTVDSPIGLAGPAATTLPAVSVEGSGAE
jgi:hypothetical protein